MATAPAAAANYVAVAPGVPGAAPEGACPTRTACAQARQSLDAAAAQALRANRGALATVVGGGLLAWASAVALSVPAASLIAGTVALALVLAALLTPRPTAAGAALLLPLAALALLGLFGNAVEPGLVFAALAGSGLGAGVLRTLHRRWQLDTLARIGCEQRLEALAAERDAARRADEDKSRFLAIASHDLRQPVHALGLFAATLEQRLHGSPDEPLMRNLLRAIDGLERSLAAMLDVSRLDAGAVAPTLQHFALRDVFRRLHMQFAGQAELSGLALRFSPGGKTVTSDPQLLERMLANLIQNALKNTERGGAVVVARSTASHINVEVWDTGAGIAAADLPRVFGEFTQLGRGERDRTRGLGMGLAIVARLARLLGHTLEVSSRPGRGTVFRVGIPLGGLAEMADATAAADTLPGPLPEARTVLVIEDESAIREGLQSLLAQWGYPAVGAASAADVERALAEVGGQVDLILSDLHLGDGPDGLDAIAAARRLTGVQVPAVLISGDTAPAELRRITESGHRVLFKPVQPRRLHALLQGMQAK